MMRRKRQKEAPSKRYDLLSQSRDSAIFYDRVADKPILIPLPNREAEATKAHSDAIRVQSTLGFKKGELEYRASKKEVSQRNKALMTGVLTSGLFVSKIIPALGMLILFFILLGPAVQVFFYLFTGNTIYYVIGAVVIALFLFKNKKN